MLRGCDHAVVQAATRYGVRLDDVDFAAMVEDIIASLADGACRALMTQQQPNGREIWIVRIPAGPAVRVVYEPRLAMIITVLPRAYRAEDR